MWNRKELKEKAKEVVKKNYWTAIVICFLIALLTGEFGMSIIGIGQEEKPIAPYIDLNYSDYNQENEINNSQENITESSTNETQLSIQDKWIINKKEIKETLDSTQRKAIEAIEADINSVTKSQKYILKIWDAINSFSINQNELGISLSIGALLSFAFTMFIADPLIVGGKKYFLNARKNSKTKVGIILEIFKDGNWLNVAIIMFLRNLYNALWYLTIVGGIIKTYEYRMIPYILAENPKIKRKEAFKISKEMMKGNKWKTFILDMSFFGWNLLSVFTMGLLSILYVNPYNAATNAELYMKLKEENKRI